MSSVAVGKTKAGHKEELVASDYHWEVMLEGQPKEVAPGGTLKYCVTQVVEDLRIVGTFTVKHSVDPNGEHRYVARVFGPSGAGESDFHEGVVHGRQESVSFGFVPFQFPALTRTTNRPVFPEGTYRPQVQAIVGRSGHKRSLTLGESDTITLTGRGC